MYQVLYRKYRPKVFSDVVGQEHITKTLAHEVETGRLSHAYLFTGSRGTGKTTCAKILAKAVNCENPQNGNPCGECEVCRGIESGAILDVVEIDAASNNGVDNIRDIRDESGFAPARSKFRVYIIDEVHMLSIGAFNALLKTLEEPPEHVKFILATTEVHKLPATILSRCQRFDFKRITTESMVGRMQYIADKEGFALSEDAAALIARLSDGGMRDALSTLDQCAAREKDITAQTVQSVCGLTGRHHLFAFAEAAAEENAAECLEIISELHSSSFDMERMCSELISHFRSLMIVKTVKNASNILIGTKEELELYQKQSELFTLEGILCSISLLQESLAVMKKGVNKRIEMEMAAIRLSHPKLKTDEKTLLRRIAKLELALQSGSFVPAEKESKKEPEAEKNVHNRPQAQTEEYEKAPPAAAEPPQKQSEAAPEDSADVVFDEWPSALSELSGLNKPLWGVLSGSTAFIRGEFILIKSENPTFPSFIRTGNNARDVKEAVFRSSGKRFRLGIYTPKQGEDIPKEKADPLDAFLNKAKNLGVNIDAD